jgi:hypothetical protein
MTLEPSIRDIASVFNSHILPLQSMDFLCVLALSLPLSLFGSSVDLAAETTTHLTHATFAIELCGPPFFGEDLCIEVGVCSLKGAVENALLPIQGPKRSFQGRHRIVKDRKIEGVLEWVSI